MAIRLGIVCIIKSILTRVSMDKMMLLRSAMSKAESQDALYPLTAGYATVG